MRRVLGLVAVIAIVTAIAPATVAAAAPDKYSGAQTGIMCDLDGEVGNVGIFAQLGDDGSGYADVLVWAPDAEPDAEPAIVTAWSTTAFDGTTLEVSFDLMRPLTDEAPDPVPVGTASLRATLAPNGPAEDFGGKDGRDGNRSFRVSSTLQLLSVDGILSIDLLDGHSESLDLDGCGASTHTVTSFVTNPNAWIYGGEQVFINCEWSDERGTTSVFAVADESGVLGQVVSIRGDRVLLGMASPVLTATAYAGTYDLVDVTGTGDVVGTASATASLSGSGERITDVEWVDPHRFSVLGERLSVAGTMTIDVDGSSQRFTMDDSACRAGDVRIQVMEKMPRG
jgi:hypothetical protein